MAPHVADLAAPVARRVHVTAARGLGAMGDESRVRILVIDDDELVRGTIGMMLEGAGYDVALAVNGQDGLRRFDDESFDLVICDIFMPVMEGFGTLRELRHRQPALPVIMMTGGSQNVFRIGSPASIDYLAMATQLSATSTIEKPFSGSQLLPLVQQCLASEGASRHG